MLRTELETGTSRHLERLVYELLDAHDDTVRLAAEVTSDQQWEIHLGYLRDLQRVGREILAHAHAGGIA